MKIKPIRAEGAVGYVTLTKDQLQILQHALGHDEFGQPECCRNRYISDKDSDLDALVNAGFMKSRALAFAGGMRLYFATDKGHAAMLEQSPKPPKLTRGQRRYQDYLANDGNMTFGEWLGIRKGFGDRAT